MSFLILEGNKSEAESWKRHWEKRCDEIYIWLPHNWAGYGKSHTQQNKEKCRSCGRPGKDFVVRANGDISVCCWDFNRELIIGNIKENSFKEIYKGKKLLICIKIVHFLCMIIYVKIVTNCMTDQML